ncbi:MAG: hypothetical protein K6A32_01340 [Bacteroidales bacterium]|nr:hypothetical protein [Bacteroidales bacterium]
MDTIITFAKENYDLITLAVAFIGVVVSIVSVFYEHKKNKEKKQKQDQQ